MAAGLVSDVVAEICIFAPFFLLPRIAESSLGAFGKVAGIANARGRSLHGRARKATAEKTKEGLRKSATGERYKGVAGKIFNKPAFIAGNAAYGKGAARFAPFGKNAQMQRVGAISAASQQAARDMQAHGVSMDPFSAREFAAYGYNSKALEQRAHQLMEGDDSWVKNSDGSFKLNAAGERIKNADAVSTGKALMTYRAFAGRGDARLAAAQVSAEAGKLTDEAAFGAGRLLGTGRSNMARDAFVDSLYQTNARKEMMTQFSRSTDFNWGAGDNQPMYAGAAAGMTKAQAKEVVHANRMQRFHDDFVTNGKFSQEDLQSIKNADNARDYAQGLIDYTQERHTEMTRAQDAMGAAQSKMERAANILNSSTATEAQKIEAGRLRDSAASQFRTAQKSQVVAQQAAERGAQKIGYMTYLGGYFREGTGAAIQGQLTSTVHQPTAPGEAPYNDTGTFMHFLREQSQAGAQGNGRSTLEAEAARRRAAGGGPQQHFYDQPEGH
ncbi:MAG TPA: hypothetical protein VGS28_01755 [Candidatus Saccharimonadales bacterium]|nr:hypothetical protein [Candidatus Saccharimonadales bacterium]